MNKKMLFMVMAVLAISLPACADDDMPGVVARTDCAAVNAQIAELAKIESPSDDDVEKLAELRETARRDCVKRIGGRRTSGRTGALPVAVASENAIVAPVDDVDDTDAVDDDTAPVSDSDDISETENDQLPVDASDDAQIAQTPQLDAEQIAKNIQAGLCGDGEKPNKFGCCAGETFRDLGNLVFACCPDDGGECFPPIE